MDFAEIEKRIIAYHYAGLKFSNLFWRNKMSKTMMTFSSGIELSEDTIVSALKKAGISVEPSKPKYIFKAGDVVENDIKRWRLIISFNGETYSINQWGFRESICQKQFEENGYKYIGRLSDIV